VFCAAAVFGAAAKAGVYEQRTCAFALVDYEKVQKECGLANVAEAISLFNGTEPKAEADIDLKSALGGVSAPEAFKALCEAHPGSAPCVGIAGECARGEKAGLACDCLTGKAAGVMCKEVKR
jgi:hypothetical protein